jgi:hypothetical protein
MQDVQRYDHNDWVIRLWSTDFGGRWAQPGFRWSMLFLMLLPLVGCGNRGASLEGFEAAYGEALQGGRTEELYDLLDTGSRRRIDKMLDTMRGFDHQAQNTVLQQLGSKASNMEDMSPQAFFGLWWNAILGGKQASVKIQQAEKGATSASMSITVQGRTQDIELIQESGRWVWRLPQGTSVGPKMPQ